MKNIPIYLMLIFGALLVSCEKPVDFNQDIKTPKLVINSFFSPDSTWALYLSHSLTVIERGDLKPVNDADVNLYADDVFVTGLELTADGKYVSGIKPVENKTYRIEVEAPNYKSVNATGKIPGKTLEVRAVDTAITAFFDQYYLKFSIKIKDEGEDIHYYGIRLFGYSGYGWNEVYFISSDPVLNIGSDYATSAFFDNNLFTNSETTIELLADIIGYEGMDFSYEKIKLIIETYTEETYLYNQSYEAYQYALGDFFAEPVQVFSNINNGFGIFGGLRTKEFPISL